MSKCELVSKGDVFILKGQRERDTGTGTMSQGAYWCFGKGACSHVPPTLLLVSCSGQAFQGRRLQQ